MMKEFKRYTVTTALPYANGPVHIGHLAGVYVPADIYVRYLRLKHKDVIFIGGSDEHGVPITLKARNEGVTPQQIVDRYHNIIKDSFKKFGISYDIYSRTSSKIHHETAAEFFKTLYDNGEFVEKISKQYFDEVENQFLADRYIIGTCPKCEYEAAYGDQCEHCGSSLSPDELINPRSVISGNKPILKETKHWYLPLDKYENWLKQWILEEHKEWKPNVYGQCKSWLDAGLFPRAVTRDLNWGVKVPLPEAENKVLYVWFDAPIGYISATKELRLDWKKYWKDSETKLVHFIGKDNIVFHCIIFPSMLKQEGSYILPENVPANEFLNLEGDKISTSRNWAVWLHEYLEEFPNKQDVLRYVLCANAPETKDSDFTWKDFQARNNNELVAILGNFINRALVLTHKYYDGKIPAPSEITDKEKEIREEILKIKSDLEKNIENYKFREALKDFMQISRIGNKYLADTEPWKLIKTEPERVKTIMYYSLQLCAISAVLGEMFLPFSMEKLRNMLNMEKTDWEDVLKFDLLKPEHKINQAELLFEIIDDSKIDEQLNKLAKTKEMNESSAKTVSPQKEEITYDDFVKQDIRVATILEAEKVPKADKLLKLLVDTGIDKRTIVSGIAEYYKPEEIIGKQVCVLVNLAPRKLRGIESAGMILMATDKDGSLKFVSPEKLTANGSIIS
ncbi:MAG TPA: methionine--tRNA ligase [Bacteroidales bacterium]|nr:methionine--tRNA ligase [Bacteroidales bacterium]HOR59832.1 methionine--tRNA ligase [Bacteroidales bacterium]HPL03919.1 methionine--tRNA ligase [Bacteroidales bacterium]